MTIGSVIRRVSGMPPSVIAWLDGAAAPCSGELLAALDALWKSDPLAQDKVLADGRRLLLVAFKRVEQRERWVAERECGALLARLRLARETRTAARRRELS